MVGHLKFEIVGVVWSGGCKNFHFCIQLNGNTTRIAVDDVVVVVGGGSFAARWCVVCNGTWVGSTPCGGGRINQSIVAVVEAKICTGIGYRIAGCRGEWCR